ncbi:MAG TPA: hypothetical protein VMM78_04925 [Thermomicrobiales bacterium]|nr:hypothetical protein [Thermomicrobiales bacterium]
MTCRHGAATPPDQLALLDSPDALLSSIPYRAWALLTGVAVGGSLVYGSSLALVLPSWRPAKAGLWLTLSAGAGWFVLGPALILVTGRRPAALAHACLVTMLLGEAVLVSGAAMNVAARLTGVSQRVDMGRVNLAVVAASNIVMASALTVQLDTLGVPRWKTLLAWMLALNGTGAIVFSVLRRALKDGG